MPSPDTIWILASAILVASSCAILGCYLLLRQMTMLGDAISHAVLPGIVIAFLVSNSLHSLPALLGAASSGLLASIMIESIRSRGQLASDASIGLVFTFLFAIGVIMVSAQAGNADIDQECVLYGQIEFVGFDARIYGMPASVFLLGINLIAIILFVLIGYRGLFLSTFDPAYAAVLGFSTLSWHYALMAMVSFSSVVSFESVGAILVVAFLVGPAASAHLLTDKLRTMIFLSVALGILAAILGYWLADFINASISGAISTVIGVEFLLVFLFAPKRGILRRKFSRTESETISPVG
jgi:manganese/zinc/iron transport system permease protein